VRRLACGLIVLGCVVAGMGWLYLLRHAGVLDAGPSVSGALPLQQLAGDDAQPLLRMAVAWLPLGAVAGAGLSAAGVSGRGRRVAWVGGVTAVVLIVTGAISDAAAISGAVGSHLGPQFGRAGTSVTTALMIIGSLLVGGVRGGAAGARRERRPAASGP
jgi:hypothetical protein